MSDNSALHKAMANKNDEFYTQYADIENEMNAYYDYDNEVFKDKVVLCPCDDPERSNFTRFFVDNFERFDLKKLISTCIANKDASDQISMFDTEIPHGKIFTLTKGEKIPEHIGFDYLEGTGDFKSGEVTKLRDEADFIITNPPFSLYRSFMAWVMRGKDKKFSLLGNQNMLANPRFFRCIPEEKMWIGATSHGQDLVFEVPHNADVDPRDRERAKRMGYDGDYTRLGSVLWYTNISHGNIHRKLELKTMKENLSNSPHEAIRQKGYVKYDNKDAIDVPYVDAIPSDYGGVMGVPITFLYKYDPDKFEIAGFSKGDDGKDLSVNGQYSYCRILIRHKR